ncbi:hypothetical protein niasHT_000848 [Heterodera trifolii]|uniref:Uncharacterized protein n=1 Tax=Heterodera trifolii TaxID=157864 RepID=A0ABD2LVB1_9BILA
MKSLTQITPIILPIFVFLLVLSPPPFAIGQDLCQWESGKCVDYGCPYQCLYDTEPECGCTSPKKYEKFFKHDVGRENANPLA